MHEHDRAVMPRPSSISVCPKPRHEARDASRAHTARLFYSRSPSCCRERALAAADLRQQAPAAQASSGGSMNVHVLERHVRLQRITCRLGEA